LIAISVKDDEAMSMDALAITGELSHFEQLRYGRQIVLLESKALEKIASRLDGEFCRAVKYLYECRGNVIVTGIGKAGLIGHKIMATLASTGTASHFLHPAEAVHGDLGRVHREDVMLILSQSGETDEVVRLLPSLTELGVPILAITASATSQLGRAATVVIELGPLEEACALGLAPSTSTTAMLAIGDALALVTSRQRNFGREDFARFHPGGSLGNKLSKVEHHCRPLAQCRVAEENQTVREMLVRVSKPGRRTGATMLVDPNGVLTGIFTDSDLARLFEHHRDGELDRPVANVMTHHPLSVPAGSMMADAVAIIAERKISELPVVDAEGRPLGLIDITDVVALLPKETLPANPDMPRRQKHPSLTSASTLRIIHEPDGGDES
jgi:arabinose-5-phosphate isomerase